MKTTLAYSPLLNKLQENKRAQEKAETPLPDQHISERIIDYLDWSLKKLTPYFFLAAIPYVGYLIVRALFFL